MLTVVIALVKLENLKAIHNYMTLGDHLAWVIIITSNNNKKIPAFAENPLHPFNFLDLLAEFACLL